MSAYQEFCKSMVEKIFTLIEKEKGLLEWRKGWSTEVCELFPEGKNGLFHGSNRISLFMDQINNGFKSNVWLTFNQVRELDGCVKKGAKGTKVCLYRKSEKTDHEKITSETLDKKEKEKKLSEYSFFKYYYVFNKEQTDLAITTPPPSEFKSKKIDDLLSSLDVTISHFGDHAYYLSKSNTIVLPDRNNFDCRENYYATLLHELVHWTGRKIKRESLLKYHESVEFRAEEELVAEIGSLLLATHFNVTGRLENHASYIESWKKKLDEKAVMRAISKAEEAFNFLVSENQFSNKNNAKNFDLSAIINS